jgi:hypothetical protein
MVAQAPMPNPESNNRASQMFENDDVAASFVVDGASCGKTGMGTGRI